MTLFELSRAINVIEKLSKKSYVTQKAFEARKKLHAGALNVIKLVFYERIHCLPIKQIAKLFLLIFTSRS